MKIYKYLKTFKKGKNFKSWLFKIVVNSSYDFLKKRKRYEKLIEDKKVLFVNHGPDPEKMVLEKELREKIYRCLQTLSPKERAVFLLRDGEGFSIKEASEILGSSSMSIRAHLSHARHKIRMQFERTTARDKER